MPTSEMATTNERLTHEPTRVASAQDDVLRELALKHLEHVRKLKLYASAYVLALIVLTPVWIVTQYMDADGWPERLSTESNPGDWDPWLLWVGLVGGFLVGLAALRVHFRPPTGADVEREIRRMKVER